MRNENRFYNYINVVNERKNFSLLSTVFFLILSVLIIGYVMVEASTSNIITLIVLFMALGVSIYNLVINTNKLNKLETNAIKYING